jgi:aquaporin Z
MKRYLAEFVGTWVLMFCGIGTAMYDGKNEGHLGIALAFGFALFALVAAIGPISGCHVNPAVTVGLAVAKRFKWSEVPWYVIAQLLGGVCAFGTLVLVLLMSGKYDQSMAVAVANGYDLNSPLGVGWQGAFLIEAFMTMVLVLTVLGATAEGAPPAAAGVAIGAALAVANFVAIPITNASINPARSLGPALYAQGDALTQLWLFLVAPCVGGVVAALVYRVVARKTAAA